MIESHMRYMQIALMLKQHGERKNILFRTIMQEILQSFTSFFCVLKAHFYLFTKLSAKLMRDVSSLHHIALTNDDIIHIVGINYPI